MRNLILIGAPVPRPRSAEELPTGGRDCEIRLLLLGGIAFVTAVVLPAVARLAEPAEQLDAWPRIIEPAGWWLAAR